MKTVAKPHKILWADRWCDRWRCLNIDLGSLLNWVQLTKTNLGRCGRDFFPSFFIATGVIIFTRRNANIVCFYVLAGYLFTRFKQYSPPSGLVVLHHPPLEAKGWDDAKAVPAIMEPLILCLKTITLASRLKLTFIWAFTSLAGRLKHVGWLSRRLLSDVSRVPKAGWAPLRRSDQRRIRTA